MNEELQKTLIDLINSSKNFVIEQAPDIIQQYLLAEKIHCFGIFTLGIMGIFLGIYIMKRPCDHYDKFYVIFMALLFIIVPSFMAAVVSFFAWIQIEFAPKGYLIEHVMGCCHR